MFPKFMMLEAQYWSFDMTFTRLVTLQTERTTGRSFLETSFGDGILVKWGVAAVIYTFTCVSAT